MRLLPRRVLVTGGSGFIGRKLIETLLKCDVNVVAPTRSKILRCDYRLTNPIIQCISQPLPDEWFRDVDVVIHLAAITHDIKGSFSESDYKKINTDAVLVLSKQAAKNRVGRFIFISSANVYGRKSNKVINRKSLYEPFDITSCCKMNSEIELRQAGIDSVMGIVIICPPLVYGPGVKANFASMIRLASKNLPLPLGAINNKRSLVGIDNLVDLIVTCINHPKAANQIFLVSDDHDVSISGLLRELTLAAGKKPRLIPVPMKIIKFMATMLGKKSIADRLFGSLQLDITQTKETLGWVPPVSFQEGITRCFKKDN